MIAVFLEGNFEVIDGSDSLANYSSSLSDFPRCAVDLSIGHSPKRSKNSAKGTRHQPRKEHETNRDQDVGQRETSRQSFSHSDDFIRMIIFQGRPLLVCTSKHDGINRQRLHIASSQILNQV